MINSRPFLGTEPTSLTFTVVPDVVLNLVIAGNSDWSFKPQTPDLQVEGARKNFDDYLVPILHFTNEKTEAQRRTLPRSPDMLEWSRNQCLLHCQHPAILEAQVLFLCLSAWAHHLVKSTYIVWPTMGLTPSIWLPGILPLYIETPVFIHPGTCAPGWSPRMLQNFWAIL